jgi:hypothetical protein
MNTTTLRNRATNEVKTLSEINYMTEGVWDFTDTSLFHSAIEVMQDSIRVVTGFDRVIDREALEAEMESTEPLTLDVEYREGCKHPDTLLKFKQ